MRGKISIRWREMFRPAGSEVEYTISLKGGAQR